MARGRGQGRNRTAGWIRDHNERTARPLLQGIFYFSTDDGRYIFVIALIMDVPPIGPWTRHVSHPESDCAPCSCTSQWLPYGTAGTGFRLLSVFPSPVFSFTLSIRSAGALRHWLRVSWSYSSLWCLSVIPASVFVTGGVFSMHQYIRWSVLSLRKSIRDR